MPDLHRLGLSSGMRWRLPDFLGLDDPASYPAASTVVLPLPFERTTTYGKGTAAGPAALLAASHHVETYDEELEREPCRHGIFTADAFDPETQDLAKAIDALQTEAARHIKAGKFLITLGGEHSLTTAPVRACLDHLAPDRALGVVQFDAHADLRPSYEGSAYSHASVMYRLLELGIPSLAVGIRSLSSEEGELIREHSLPTIFGHQLEAEIRRGSTARFEHALERLPEDIYLTFDLDFFDPSLLPATGTPEPGGGSWYPTLDMLRLLFSRKRVVAMDVVELAPRPELPTSDFVAAKLVHKCIGYRFDLEPQPVLG